MRRDEPACMRHARPDAAARLLAAAIALAAASSALASAHTPAECREGGEFIRNAALSRDNGLPREAFLNHLIADLSMIRGLPASVRWFARDEADESLLIRYAERVYAQRAPARDHEAAFLAECARQVDASAQHATP